VPGAYYLSDATPGFLTRTPPSTLTHFVIKLGLALSATTMLMQIGTPLVNHG
jgi:hypothetical protein